MHRESGYGFVVLGLGVAALTPGCADDCADGDEGCPCYENNTCNGALACRSATCVDLNASADEASGATGQFDACIACAEGSCAAEVDACRASVGCEGFVDCVIACGTDQSCQMDCSQDTSVEAQTNSVLLTACAYVACPAECTGSGNAAVPGTGSGTPAGPPGPGGTLDVPSDGVPSDDVPSDDVPSDSTPVEPEPAMPGDGTNWLVLEGETAPSSSAPNGLLGIEGVFYAYDDGCATYTWDATGRCISGTHCAPSATNWGVGIGFDFYNDGVQKTPWSATAHMARGVEWFASGMSTGAFQVWLTNMDPSFGASCNATADCSIAGPPDGYSNPSFHEILYFSNLFKDDWGGTGVNYTFDPTRILSLQFKIPSSSVNPEFALCVDQLAIVL